MNSFWLSRMSLAAAAKEIAEARVPADDAYAQDRILRKYGFSLDSLTDDECYELSRMVEDYVGNI